MENQLPAEPIIEPNLPIVDAHHHLWFLPEASIAAMELQQNISDRALAPMFRRHARYLFEEFMGDLGSGHNVRATVFVEASTMYRASGPELMKSVGEIEFANGIAAMGASGLFGESKLCAAIVGGVDLMLGAAVEEVLAAHVQAGGGRYRGVRSPAVYDADVNILGGYGKPDVLLDPTFRTGFRKLHQAALSFDVWLFEPQLPQLIDLARAFPETQIILDHAGTPLGVGCYAGLREQRFVIWRDSIRTLARCENVAVKLGGFGIPYGGFPSYMSRPPATSEQLATEWRPYIESIIEIFGVDRCMFESNFPVDSAVGTYSVIWNAFKRVVVGASSEEKAALFSGTATRIYRLDI